MKGLLELALDKARKLGAEYADIRSVSSETERISTRNGHVQSIGKDSDSGFGIRVLVDGAWGFFSCSISTGTDDKISKAGLAKVAEEAVGIAKASGKSLKKPVTLTASESIQDSWTMPAKIDPFAMKIEDKVGYLLDSERLMKKAAPVSLTYGSLVFFREHKLFLSTEGSSIEQRLTQSGGNIGAIAKDGQEVQGRSYAAQFGGDFALKGWEHIEELDFPGNAPRVAREACELVKAPQCPSGMMDTILEGSQLALQIHESCGHPIELDRVLGMEAGMVGMVGKDRALEIVERALKASLADQTEVRLTGPRYIDEAPCHFESTARATPELRAENVMKIVARAGKAGFDAAGAHSTSTNEIAAGNSLGVRAYGASTSADLTCVVLSGEGSGFAQASSRDLLDIDPDKVAEEAVSRCAMNNGQIALEPGEYAVVLEPYAVADLISFLSGMGFSALSYQEGRSFICGRLNTQIMSPLISIWDDGLDQAGAPFPFDNEGNLSPK